MAARALRRRDEVVLHAVRPNVGVEAMYRRRLRKLIDEMHASIAYWIEAAYKANEPAMAADEAPYAALRAALRKLRARWQRNFNQAAEDLARYFAKDVADRSDAALRSILRRGGFSVKFTMTPAARDIIGATVAENVSLIKSIPQQYLKDVEGAVMRSVQTGRDLGSLTKELQRSYGVTYRRAALIARDQNNKATSAMQAARQKELGITEAIWQHSHAGKVPRPSHVKMDGRRYDVAKGMWDPDEGKFIWPGELINCLPGNAPVEFAYGAEVIYRHRFRGELTEIVTSSGKTFRATPNHPIFTPNGWIPVGGLHEGDDAVEISDDVFPSPPYPVVLEQNVDRAVPSFAEIFDAFCRSGVFEVGHGGDFHGDVVDSDVDVVFATRPLSIGGEIFLDERVKNFLLAVSAKATSRSGLVEQFAFAGAAPAPSDIGGVDELPPFFFRRVFHPHEHGIAAPSHFAAREEDARNDRVSRDLIFTREGKNTDPSLMLPTQTARIVKVNHSAFDDHVYNLQTKWGWYTSGGIIAHNCRCTSRSVLPGFS